MDRIDEMNVQGRLSWEPGQVSRLRFAQAFVEEPHDRVELAPTIDGWGELPLGREVQAAFPGAAVRMATDAKAAAQAAVRWGALAGFDPAIYLNLGTGLSAYARLAPARFIRRHAITCFRQNPFFPVNTLTIMRGAIAAQRLGIFGRYVDEIFRHIWADPKKLDDPAVLRAALVESGFDADALLALTQTQAVKDELLANTQRSVERGTFGSPTFFVNDEIFFGKDKLRDVEEAIVASRQNL